MDWISVKDRLPKHNELVSILTESGDMTVGGVEIYSDEQLWFFGNQNIAWDYIFNFDSGSVTHWAPLLKPLVDEVDVIQGIIDQKVND